MTTKSTRPVTRESSAFVRDRGLRPIIVTVSGSILELRAKGLRQREVLDLASCYSIAVKQRVASEKAERAAAKKAKAFDRTRPMLRRAA
jgi:hypothetical protein